MQIHDLRPSKRRNEGTGEEPGDNAFPGCEYTAEQIEFMMALDRYKRANYRPYPTWNEVLAVALSLGYRKVARPTPLPVFKRGN